MSHQLNGAGKSLDIHGADGQAPPHIVSSVQVPMELGAGSSLRNLRFTITTLFGQAIAATGAGLTFRDVVISSSTVGSLSLRNAPNATIANARFVRTGIDAYDSPGLVLNHVTVQTPGATALFVYAPNMDVTADVTNSILSAHSRSGLNTGTDVVARRGGSTNQFNATVTLTHSSFFLDGSPNNGDGTFNIGPGNVTALAPKFARQSETAQQAWDSPTIDAGVAVPSSTPPITVDVDGDPRTIGLAPDIGGDEFRLPPGITDSAVTDVTSTSATVRGVATPNALPSTYHVEHGVLAAGNVVTAAVGFGPETPATIAVPIAGLEPGTTYRARVVATNAVGTTHGVDVHFATPPLAPPPPLIGALSGPEYALITPDIVGENYQFEGASADGTKVWFSTNVSVPGTGDNDAGRDVYEWMLDAPLRLISTGGSGETADWQGASEDGSRIWFRTAEAIPGTGDSDVFEDVFERSATGVRLITGPTNGGTFVGAATDGSRVFFVSTDMPGTGDTDGGTDIYERRVDGTVAVLTGSGTHAANFHGASADGTRVWFSSFGQPDSAPDTDGTFDVYEAHAGVIRLLSTNGLPFVANFAGGARSGDRVWFTTDERLLPLVDQNLVADTYVRSSDGTLRLVLPASVVAGALAPGSIRAPSWGVEVPAAPGLNTLYRATVDGTRSWFYGHPFGAGVRNSLAERDPSGAIRNLAGVNVGDFKDATADGSTAWYTVRRGPGPLDPLDLYESTAGVATRIGPTGSAAAFFADASDDGSRLTFDVSAPISGSGDTDSGRDLYQRLVRHPVVTVAPGITGDGRVGGVHACGGDQVKGGLHTIARTWLRDGVALRSAAAPYSPNPGDAGHVLTCRTQVTNRLGSAEATSRPVTVAPFVTGVGKVRGLPIRGTRVHCDAAIVGAASSTTTWLRGSVAVGTGPSRVVNAADVGRQLRCEVTAQNNGGVTSTKSDSLLIPSRCRVPRLKGLTPVRARAALESRGCRTEVRRIVVPGRPRGRVLSSNPAAGVRSANGATVIITVRR